MTDGKPIADTPERKKPLPESPYAKEQTFQVQAGQWEGPLDLLLYLIQEKEMDIFKISLSDITDGYLSQIDKMQELNLDVAADFLWYAALLIHMKSRSLLPDAGGDQEEEEIDIEEMTSFLMDCLLQKKKYIDAARKLDDLPMLGRDVFSTPGERALKKDDDADLNLEEVSVFTLVKAFAEILAQKEEEEQKRYVHTLDRETVTLDEKIHEIFSILRASRRVLFRDLLGQALVREDIVTTFLALLELTKLRILLVYQSGPGGEIYCQAREDMISKVQAEEVVRLITADKPEDVPST